MKTPDLAFRVDESGRIPEGARVMSEGEVYEYQMRKVVKYEPKSDMYFILKANNLVVSGSLLSTLGMVSLFRRVFKIPLVIGSIWTLIPTVGGTIVLASILHGPSKYKIIQGNNSQSIRWQSGIGNAIACGPLSTIVSLSYCLGLRRKIDGSTFVQIFKSANTRQLMYISLSVTFFQFCAGYFLADKEIKCLEKASLFHHKRLIDNEGKE